MEKQEQLSFSGIIRTAWQFRYTLIITTIVATIATYGITFLITPQFKTTAVIYPTASINSAKELLNQVSSSEGISEFGKEDDAEQLMEVISGNSLRRKVANKINLWEHYKINIEDKKKNYYFDIKWEKNVSLSLTKFNALRIEVYDNNPKTAALIANTIAEEADSAYRNARKERAIAAYNAITNAKKITLEEYQKHVDSLTHFNKLGVINVSQQIKELYRAKAEAIAAGSNDKSTRIERELDALKKYSASVFGLEAYIEAKQTDIIAIEQREKVALLEAMQEIPSIFNIDKAEVPEVKAYPRRALFAIGAGLATFILGLFIILLNSYLANEVFTTGKHSNK